MQLFECGELLLERAIVRRLGRSSSLDKHVPYAVVTEGAKHLFGHAVVLCAEGELDEGPGGVGSVGGRGDVNEVTGVELGNEGVKSGV
jgi:hypothetical protein